jgi:hypothetical protein
MSKQVKYIKHTEIDAGKWEKCIENAENSRFYANMWHLDRTAIVWDALVFGDYKYVMPLPIRKKFGFSYIYQPLFCQQLGIFPEPSVSISEIFYNALFKKFRFVDIYLNSQNPIIQKNKEVEFSPRHNFLLDLQFNYKSLARSFSTNTKRNISKAAKNNLQYISGIGLEEYLAFKLANLINEASKKNIEKLKSVIAYGQYKGLGEIYGVYSTENELCAAVYFCRWKNRIIYLNAVTSENGKKSGAMYLLVDNFIRENAERDLKLDFEGSMIPGVARFYSGFGAVPETYFQLKFNRLPLPFRWLKRN